MIKYCKGCGVRLQDNNVLLEGYTNNLSKDLCKRCFRLKHYGEYEVVTKSNDEYIEIIKGIGKTKSLVLYVVDLLSIPSDLGKVKEYLGNNKVILVLNKKDVLPLSVTDKKILDYIDNVYGDLFTDKIVVSAHKNYNIDTLMKLIKKHRVYKNVYVAGNTNAGKSTLINKLIDNYSIDTSLITISSMPSTTLDEIKIPFKDFFLIDTPGLVDVHNIVNFIDEKNIKKLSTHKEIKPRTYQIKKSQALLFEDFLRIDYVEGERNSFTVFVSNDIKIKRINGKRHDAFQTASNEEQMSKTNNELIEHRTKEMRNKDNFGYLEVSQNEDVRIVEIMERINKDLTDLLNMNLKVYNETKEKISKFANDKIVLEKESSKVREEIQNKTNELNGFMLKKVPDIRELIDGDKKISGVDDVDEEYDVVSNNTENLEDIKQTISANNTVDIPRVNPEVSQGPNAFVGLREDNAGKFKVINIDEYRNNVQEDTMSKVVGF